MQMKVRHHLAGIGTDVRCYPIARLRNALGVGYLLGSQYHPAHQACVLPGQILHRTDVLLGYDQNMRGNQRMYVAEGDQFIRLINHVCRQLLRYDATEQAVLQAFYPQMPISAATDSRWKSPSPYANSAA